MNAFADYKIYNISLEMGFVFYWVEAMGEKENFLLLQQCLQSPFCGYHQFFLFPRMFSTLSRTKTTISGTLKLSSANASNSDHCEMLLYGKQLVRLQNVSTGVSPRTARRLIYFVNVQHPQSSF